MEELQADDLAKLSTRRKGKLLVLDVGARIKSKLVRITSEQLVFICKSPVIACEPLHIACGLFAKT